MGSRTQKKLTLLKQHINPLPYSFATIPLEQDSFRIMFPFQVMKGVPHKIKTAAIAPRSLLHQIPFPGQIQIKLDVPFTTKFTIAVIAPVRHCRAYKQIPHPTSWRHLQTRSSLYERPVYYQRIIVSMILRVQV